MFAKEFFDILKDNEVDCFCGVPDSLLKDFCAYITDNVPQSKHTITANEGNAIGLASGHYLATGKSALVYMQNSGIGNCVNPLLSLCDEEVYKIPLLMVIGWRGEPGQKDEPQHIKQGKVTLSLLDTMGIKYSILPKEFEDAKPIINNAFQYMKETKCPYALIVRKGLFEKYSLINKKKDVSDFQREDAIETVIKKLNFEDIIVSTTGHISREVYETRNRLGQSHKQDFLTVGSMGHSSSIALGIAIEKPNRRIFCFDGDGAFLMHQGALVINASKNLKNFKHIVFNNEAHDSVGSQPTALNSASITDMVRGAGYQKIYSVNNKSDLEKILPEFLANKETSLLEIKVKCGARADLGRPKEKPFENKEIFMQNIKQIEFLGKNSIKNLKEIIKIQNVKNALIFTGKKSFQSIKPIIEEELKGVKTNCYNDFSPNPKEEEINIAVDKIKEDFDIVIAVGGGSVIDFAKAFRKYKNTDKKLIAIPTTCGTGSEATQFAVIYINGKKTSLDEKNILPDYAIVDSQFVEKNPKYLKACTAMDAFCQAIESYFASGSNELSRHYAMQAMILCKDNLTDYVNSQNEIFAEKMSFASNLAGKAINISRTTAAHALSYKITTDYGIPHGAAVALSMADLFVSNYEITPETCTDKRGCDFVKERLNEILEILGLKNSKEFYDYWYDLMDKIGLEYNFDKLNIKDKNNLILSVNKQRLSNNPKDLSNDLKNFWNK